MKDRQLKNKVALVTGASSGIGKSIAIELAKRGARICFIGRSKERLKKALKKSQKYGDRSAFYEVDITDDEDARAVAKRIKNDFGRLDILVHSAGIISLGRIDEDSVENFDGQFKVNLRAPYLMTQLLLPLLKKSDAGQIFFINSTMGINTKAGVGQYAATKHGLKALADTLRAEVSEEGIRITSIFLGSVETPMQAEIHKVLGKQYNPENFMKPEEVAKIIIESIFLSKTVEVTEIFLRPFKK